MVQSLFCLLTVFYFLGGKRVAKWLNFAFLIPKSRLFPTQKNNRFHMARLFNEKHTHPLLFKGIVERTFFPHSRETIRQKALFLS